MRNVFGLLVTNAACLCLSFLKHLLAKRWQCMAFEQLSMTELSQLQNYPEDLTGVCVCSIDGSVRVGFEVQNVSITKILQDGDAADHATIVKHGNFVVIIAFVNDIAKMRKKLMECYHAIINCDSHVAALLVPEYDEIFARMYRDGITPYLGTNASRASRTSITTGTHHTPTQMITSFATSTITPQVLLTDLQSQSDNKLDVSLPIDVSQPIDDGRYLTIMHKRCMRGEELARMPPEGVFGVQVNVYSGKHSDAFSRARIAETHYFIFPRDGVEPLFGRNVSHHNMYRTLAITQLPTVDVWLSDADAYFERVAQYAIMFKVIVTVREANGRSNGKRSFICTKSAFGELFGTTDACQSQTNIIEMNVPNANDKELREKMAICEGNHTLVKVSLLTLKRC